VGSAANQILRARLAAGALVIAGTSAGATALGTTMILGGDARSRLLTGPGLGLVPEVIVDMHFTERRRLPRLVAAIRWQPSHLGIGIDEDTAILIGCRRFDVLGQGTVVTVEADPARRSAGLPGSGVRLHRLHAGDAFDMDRRRPVTKARNPA
jgi:cyanophycinase